MKKPFEELSAGCQRIIRFADANGGTINPMEALNHCGVFRLAARIHELDRSGWPFEHETAEAVNQFGERVRFAQYRRKP